MKALEFETQMNPGHSLSVPPAIAAAVPPNQSVRVRLLIRDGAEDAAWEEATAEEFARGYSESDAIYDYD